MDIINEEILGWTISNPAAAHGSSSKSLSVSLMNLYNIALSRSDKRWSFHDSQTLVLSSRPDFVLTFGFCQGRPQSLTIMADEDVEADEYGEAILKNVVEPDQLLCYVLGCRIPSKVLRGPWNSGKCAMLVQFLEAGCRLDRSGETLDEEIANAGLKQAITQPSIRAIVTLVGSMRRYANVISSSLAKMKNILPGCPWSKRALVSSLEIMVTTEHLELAIAHDSPLQIFECLLDAMYLNIDWHNRKITTWIITKRTLGDERGQFLFDRFADNLSIWPLAERQAYRGLPRIWEAMSAEWVRSEPSWLNDEDDT